MNAQYIKVVCISDTHSKANPESIPNGDILIHAGDVTFGGSYESIIYANDFMSMLPHKHKIFIAGNHDVGLEFENYETYQYDNTGFFNKALLPYEHKVKSILANYHYLKESSVTLEGYKFYGFPYTTGHRGAFSYGEEVMQQHADMIPCDTDVLITHSAPYGILDTTVKGKHIGSVALLNRIKQLPKLKYHIFGHVHESHGIVVKNGITFVNVAICNEKFIPIQSPTILHLPRI